MIKNAKTPFTTIFNHLQNNISELQAFKKATDFENATDIDV